MANLLYNLAQPFSDTKQYTQGTIVIHNDRMYEMTADEYTPGAFDLEKFTERFLSEMMSGKVNDKPSKEYTVVHTMSYGSDPTVYNTKYMLGGRGYTDAILVIDGASTNSNTVISSISITCEHVKITELNTNYGSISPLNKCLIYELKDIKDDDYLLLGQTYCRTVSVQFIGIK